MAMAAAAAPSAPEPSWTELPSIESVSPRAASAAAGATPAFSFQIQVPSPSAEAPEEEVSEALWVRSDPSMQRPQTGQGPRPVGFVLSVYSKAGPPPGAPPATDDCCSSRWAPLERVLVGRNEQYAHPTWGLVQQRPRLSRDRGRLVWEDVAAAKMPSVFPLSLVGSSSLQVVVTPEGVRATLQGRARRDGPWALLCFRWAESPMAVRVELRAIGHMAPVRVKRAADCPKGKAPGGREGEEDAPTRIAALGVITRPNATPPPPPPHPVAHPPCSPEAWYGVWGHDGSPKGLGRVCPDPGDSIARTWMMLAPAECGVDEVEAALQSARARGVINFVLCPLRDLEKLCVAVELYADRLAVDDIFEELLERLRTDPRGVLWKPMDQNDARRLKRLIEDPDVMPSIRWGSGGSLRALAWDYLPSEGTGTPVSAFLQCYGRSGWTPSVHSRGGEW